MDLIHADTRHLIAGFRIDGLKAKSRGISGGNQVKNLSIRASAVEFVYSLKTRRSFNSQVKWTARASTSLTSLLFAVRTSAVTFVSKKVTMITSTNLPFCF